jgi:large repetitive protein
MTIVAPDLVFTKTGPATLNLGEQGDFTLDVHNIGNGDAWNATIVDRLPDGPNGGMCDATPQVLSAQVFANGGTPVAGKGPLVQGTDFSFTFAPGGAGCVLTVTMLTASGAIGADEHLIITYRTELDPDTQNGVSLTNVAGATEWFNADASAADRTAFVRTLTNGTVGTLDHQDAHTVTTAITGWFFEKSVANLTSGASPATGASPGDTLRYTLRLRSADTPFDDVRFHDDLGVMNAEAVFVPGSLSLVSVPAGADASNTDPNGGTNGAGILDVRNLSVSPGEQVEMQFDITLESVIDDGTIVTNQADLIDSGGVKLADSDDPNVNGPADPDVAGDEDPTRVGIGAGPEFRVEKVSSYVTGDPNVLLAGETLRYTITVQNVGTADAFDAAIVDQTPANTTYVAGSTTLNGVPLPDSSSGGSPLADGIPIHAPEDPTPGTLRAVTPPSDSNVATIVFDVVVNPNVIAGTVISNQAFVSAPGGGVGNQPSDDPRTPTPDDPTRDIIGNLPLLYAEKSAALEVDLGTPGIVDPGDVLRYTIAIHNNGRIAATEVDLADSVPANTTYVADSLTLNGLPVGQPDGGVSPLAAGIPVSSSDLTPPLPGAGEGTLTAGETAIVQFDLRVDDGVASGTLITNQAVVGSEELPDLLTDGDGNPATGPEPTVVVVGDSQQLAISKQVAVVDGGAAVAGATLEYVVTVTNIAAVPAYEVEIQDDLDAPVPGQLLYVDQSATMNGQRAGTNFSGSLLTADYFTTYGPLEPGETIVLRFRATLDANLAIGTTVTNTAVVYWNDPQQTASASVSINVGGVPGSGALSGTVWHDADFDDALDGGERLLEGWTVQLYRDGELVHTAVTDEDGSYSMAGLPPNYLTEMEYALVFAAPDAGPATAALGMAVSDFTNYLQRIEEIVLNPGDNLRGLNLPIDPNGVVYDALVRSPIAGARLTLAEANGGATVPDTCLEDPNQQNQVTLADGYYKFVLDFSDPSCPSGRDYVIQVTPPDSNYVGGESELIPAASNAATLPFEVPACPGSVEDAIPGTPQHCEVQVSESAPDTGVAARSSGTRYHLHLTLDGSQLPGSGEIFNNHIPVDPELDGALSITKTSPMLNVSRGQLVPYVITVTNTFPVELQDISIVDRFPAGFRYVEGSARLDDEPVEPIVNGRELVWPSLALASSGRHTLKLLLAVGAGVSEGEFVNRAQAYSTLTGDALSGEAFATVRLVPDPTFDCTDVIGKVYDDSNRNGYQDGDEGGLPGVRVVTARGLAATTDEHGRFHFTCAITPHEGRGSNFVLKLDDRTLPSGYRASSHPVQVKRATRGKALRFSFGASIHRVIGLDVAGAAFEPDSTEMRNQWRSRIDLLMEELQKGPAVLRLSYLADVESEQLVERRLDAVKAEIMNAWTELACCYELVVEPEVYWRLGGPPDEPKRSRR